jgi:hypothetical protein
MQTAISAQAVIKGTGQPWSHWLNWLNGINAGDMPHKEIVAALIAAHPLSLWWAQMLTVQYEQIIGRRVAGQDCSGSFSVSVSKTLPGSLDDALAYWLALVANSSEFSDIAVSRSPAISHTDKWRYWRCGLADGSRVNVNISQKSADKSSLSIQHEKLESSEQVEHWRSYWKTYIK